MHAYSSIQIFIWKILMELEHQVFPLSGDVVISEETETSGHLT
jgi:hypothetical protein